MMRKLFQKSDIVIIAALLAVSLGAYFLYGFFSQGEQSGLIAEILVDGKVERKLSLDGEETFSLEDHPHVVFAVKDSGIAFQSSDCPDKICVHTGYIKQAGQTAACLPNRMAVRIVRSGEAPTDEPDIVM